MWMKKRYFLSSDCSKTAKIWPSHLKRWLVSWKAPKNSCLASGSIPGFLKVYKACPQCKIPSLERLYICLSVMWKSSHNFPAFMNPKGPNLPQIEQSRPWWIPQFTVTYLLQMNSWYFHRRCFDFGSLLSVYCSKEALMSCCWLKLIFWLVSFYPLWFRKLFCCQWCYWFFWCTGKMKAFQSGTFWLVSSRPEYFCNVSLDFFVQRYRWHSRSIYCFEDV